MEPTQSFTDRVSAAARALLEKLTLDEKIDMLDAHHPGIERLGLPDYRLEAEGAHGLVIREGDHPADLDGTTTVFPQPLGLSMTWDKTLMKHIGAAIGDEARVYGKLVLLFPTVDMERDPRWGRNEEAYGEDPYLAGKLGVELIKGAQGEADPYLKVATTVKHFYANNYEFEREWADSVIPEALKNDYYLRVFKYVVTEGKSASLMTAYNQVNGVINMVNPELTTLVREQWGSDGYFVSDGKAFEILLDNYHQHDTFPPYAAEALKSGLDCFLTYDSSVMYQAVREALGQGLLTEADIDLAVFHQLRVLIRLGLYPGLDGNPYRDTPRSVLSSVEHRQLAQRASLEAVTLLKNDGFLPLIPAETRTIAVVGQLGDENMTDWYSGEPPYKITPLEGIRTEFPDAEVRFADGCDVVAFHNEATGQWLQVADDGSVRYVAEEGSRSLFRHLDWGYGHGFQEMTSHKYLTTNETGELRCDSTAMWGWFVREAFFLTDTGDRFIPEQPFDEKILPDGAGQPGHDIYRKPYAAGGLDTINATLSNLRIARVADGLEHVAQTVAGADAAVVLLGNHALLGARETVDRPSLALPSRFAQIFDTAVNTNPNTVLFLLAGYQYALEAQEERARAVLFTTHGMQEVGTAVARTLSGSNNPAGRLSQTWYKDDRELPNINDYDIASNKVTYMYNEEPVAHEFGFGLSYTTFGYTDLNLSSDAASVTVSVAITNTGAVPGDEVPQVYFAQIAIEGLESSEEQNVLSQRPLKRLVGFDRISLTPGERRVVTFHILRSEFGFYDEKVQETVIRPGVFDISVGASSEDIRQKGTITLQ